MQEQSVGEPLLEVADLDCSYGPLQVLFGVSLSVPEGGRVALLGTNGAGKSTLLRAVAGLMPAAAGAVRFAGEDVTALAPYERVARGITLVEGGRATFPSLTVADNLRMGAYPFLRQRRRVDERLDAVLDLFPQLRPRLEQPAGVCSGGEQQMMAVGRALVAEPRLLMIDELSLGLAPLIVQQLVEVVHQINESGVSMILVEQSANLALSVTDHAYFIEKGVIRFDGSSRELLERDDLLRSVFLAASH
jgi:branched-chain amino acid transport system ATP-binding protein